ncbi:MAG: hypothetical protein NZ570_02320 [Candidatus Caldarchaeum sp.]|nr:hypothetical protein [Candidatus Caldarchaeum sp.]MCS7136849.1 hypothetical protein [Candidatus Caldarchaeum sp.]MDW7977440.1 hypothetical protein [Candidatus Caldarchaeum sp.]MDW8360720.1 hypothetical protein [Candidatus Caldarchaeum sp.]
MVKQEELPQLITTVKSLIAQSRNILFPSITLYVEISKIEETGDSVIIEGRWSHFPEGGYFSMKIKKDDRSILSFKLEERRLV